VEQQPGENGKKKDEDYEYFEIHRVLFLSWSDWSMATHCLYSHYKGLTVTGTTSVSQGEIRGYL